MIRAGIVKIDRTLDETQAEKAGIEVQVLLRIGRDSSDVMEPVDLLIHQDVLFSLMWSDHIKCPTPPKKMVRDTGFEPVTPTVSR